MRKLPLNRYLRTVGHKFANFAAGDAVYPFYASFKVTHRCGLRCRFCNVWMEKTPDLPKEEVFKVLDNIADSSVMVLSLEGGDPLIRNDLGEILEYAHQKPFYLFFTTNGHLIEKRPMKEYGKFVDYIHVSIDEGHDNLAFLDKIEYYQSFGPEIGIQIVVTKDTLGALESKVKRVHEAKARTVIMPACHLDDTDDCYPDPVEFKRELLRLKSKYRNTIITPKGFLDNVCKSHGCSTSSIIIDSDGSLFYPCRTIGQKLYNFTEGSFKEFLKTDKALQARSEMKKCPRSCGWYQYFATDAFASPFSVVSSLSPYLFSR